jgi:Spy/CpxP family protein refolding chaperone
MKQLMLVACLLMAPLSVQAQSAQNGQMGARRELLQRQIVRRFMDRATAELGLDAATRGKLEQQMRQSGEARRGLARNTADLRRRMIDATLDSTTADAEFKRLLSDMTALRQREEDLWRSDQDALSRILTPRQQARFVFMWLRFNEQIREIALQRPGMAPPPR